MKSGLHLAFVQRILRERIVDTHTYRYIVRDRYGLENVVCDIYRIPISKLDTTAALWPGEWEKFFTVES